MNLVLWHICGNPSGCGRLGCAAGHWITPDLSLRGWLLKDGGQLWHQRGHFGALNQLPLHNPIQKRGQSIQCSLSLIITYRHHWRRSRSSSQASEVGWWLILWLWDLKSAKKNAIWDGKLYCIDQTNQTLIWWLSALISFHFSFFRFLSLYFCFVFPSLTLFFPFRLGSPADPKNSNGSMATRWWLGGAKLAPVGPTAFLFFPLLSPASHAMLSSQSTLQGAKSLNHNNWNLRWTVSCSHQSSFNQSLSPLLFCTPCWPAYGTLRARKCYMLITFLQWQDESCHSWLKLIQFLSRLYVAVSIKSINMSSCFERM